MLNIDNFPNVETINAWGKCERHFIDHHKILVSISGGSDSDIMLDFLVKVRNENRYNYWGEIYFVFFDTGIESKATKEHLDYLEKRYNIKIDRVKPKCPVPLGCKLYGLPFISKLVSQMIERLQTHNFDFRNDGNKPFEELVKKYKNMKGALTWWCNKYPAQKGKKSHFNIDNNKFLKEFMIENPPTFKISDKCCYGAKKNPSKDYEVEKYIDLKCLGLRKAEGGIRSSSIKSCFDDNLTFDTERKSEPKPYDVYRPIWWFTDKDKKSYEEFFNIKHSKCYTEYGFKRTGCMGCPFNSGWQDDLEKIKENEPMLYRAVNNIFGKSYEYVLKYRDYKKQKGCSVNKNQLSFWE